MNHKSLVITFSQTVYPAFSDSFLSMLLSLSCCLFSARTPLPLSHLTFFPPRESWESPESEDSRGSQKNFPNLLTSDAHAPHGPTGGAAKRRSLVLPTIAWFYLAGCVPAYPQKDQSRHSEPPANAGGSFQYSPNKLWRSARSITAAIGTLDSSLLGAATTLPSPRPYQVLASLSTLLYSQWFYLQF